MIYLFLILCVAVLAIESHLTAKMYKEFKRLVELMEQQSNSTTTSPLDRARERKIEYRNNTLNN